MPRDRASADRLRLYVADLSTNVLRQVVLFGERVAKEKAPKDTSGLANSIGSEVRGLTGVIAAPFGAETARIGQAVTMEFGREPGKPMPPKGVLLDWMRRRGLDPKLEYVIRRAIGRDGIEGTHYMQQAADAMLRELPTIVAAARSELAARGSV